MAARGVKRHINEGERAIEHERQLPRTVLAEVLSGCHRRHSVIGGVLFAAAGLHLGVRGRSACDGAGCNWRRRDHGRSRRGVGCIGRWNGCIDRCDGWVGRCASDRGFKRGDSAR